MTEYSVIIPTYKGFKRLPIVLNSLCRQSIPKEKLEVIVVDDGSPGLSKNSIDTLCRFYAELNLRVLRMSKNRGPAAARNFGIANSTGKIIFFTDDDCEVPALWMETHLNIYRDHPEVSAVGGWYKYPLDVQRKNVYALFFELRSQTIFSPFFYQAMDSNLFMQRKKRMSTASISFMAGNTANFSVKRLITAKVKFNERFFAPGFEDFFYSTSIQRAGFIVYAIPFFVYHNKILALKNFVKLTINRGLGRYLYNKLSNFRLANLGISSNWEIIIREIFIQNVKNLSKISPLIKKRKKALIFLAYVYFFITINFDFWYRLEYRRKRGMLL